MHDAIIIGSGPNGLAAAISLAQAGHSTLVLEAHSTPGGGVRSDALTLPGYVHDVCSAVHPTGALSPFFRSLPLDEHGLTWASCNASVAHPLLSGDAAMLYRSVDKTADRLGRDAKAYRRLVRPFLKDPEAMMRDLLAPLRFPSQPVTMARFGLRGLPSAKWLANRTFNEDSARALVAGCAAHSVLPLDFAATGAVALVFLLTGHMVDWPVAVGGSGAITDALLSYYRSLGGEIQCDTRVTALEELPPHRIVLFDTAPKGMLEIAGDALPPSYRKTLSDFHYGPGVFKVDWALSEPIPWTNPRCAEASTVHVGGTFEQIAKSERDAWDGTVSDRPFLILCQQSHADPSRAPAGKHTGYAYCHVPAGCTVDMTLTIESQVERFAPGFRDTILARHTTSPADLERYNPSYVGGAIAGGSANLSQLFTRPATRLNPYTTPNPALFICSASSPPGGGVHGMCGYWAAKAAATALAGKTPLLP